MKDKKAEGYVFTCVMIIIVCMILSVFITFALTVNTIQMVKRNSKTVLDSFVMENSIEIYDSIKQGNNETEFIDDSKYIVALTRFCTFAEKGNHLYNYDSNGDLNYYISKPTVKLSIDDKLQIYVSYTVYVPIYFAGLKVSTAQVPISVQSKFIDKF